MYGIMHLVAGDTVAFSTKVQSSPVYHTPYNRGSMEYFEVEVEIAIDILALYASTMDGTVDYGEAELTPLTPD